MTLGFFHVWVPFLGLVSSNFRLIRFISTEKQTLVEVVHDKDLTEEQMEDLDDVEREIIAYADDETTVQLIATRIDFPFAILERDSLETSSWVIVYRRKE